MQNNGDKGSLSEKFRDFGAAPSDALWERISDQLGEKKKRRIAAWWWTPGLAAALVVAIVFLWPGERTEKAISSNVHPAAASGNRQRSFPEPQNAAADRIPANDNGSDALNLPGKNGAAGDKREQNRQPHKEQRRSEGPRPVPVQDPLAEKRIPAVVPVAAENDSTLAAINSPAENDSTPAGEELLTDSSVGHELPHLPPPFTPKWSIAAHGGGSRGIAMIVNEQSAPETSGNLNANLDAFDPTIVQLRQYWSADVLVSRRLSPRFYLEAGIEAGWFRSGEWNPNADLYVSSSITITTLTFALPVSVKAVIFSTDRFRLDAGAGVVNHWPFFRKVSSVSQSAASMELIESSRSMTYVPAAQLNLGLQYRLTKRLYLEARPQVRHYFNASYGNNDPGAAPYIGKNWWGGTIGLGCKF